MFGSLSIDKYIDDSSIKVSFKPGQPKWLHIKGFITFTKKDFCSLIYKESKYIYVVGAMIKNSDYTYQVKFR